MHVDALLRLQVTSMLGEQLEAVTLTRRGVLGDRAGEGVVRVGNPVRVP